MSPLAPSDHRNRFLNPPVVALPSIMRAAGFIVLGMLIMTVVG